MKVVWHFLIKISFFWVERLDTLPSQLCAVRRYTLIPNGKICNSFEMQFVMENAQNKLVVSTKLSKESMLSTDTKFNSVSFPISALKKFAIANHIFSYKLNLLQVN